MTKIKGMPIDLRIIPSRQRLDQLQREIGIRAAQIPVEIDDFRHLAYSLSARGTAQLNIFPLPPMAREIVHIQGDLRPQH